jgi:Arc/MetJ-type ribon-helix-helix transcriptional regulator
VTEEMSTVAIPRAVRDRIQERMKGSAFRSVDDFVAFVLSRLVESPPSEGEPLSAQDESRVKERLRSLGYID